MEFSPLWTVALFTIAGLLVFCSSEDLEEPLHRVKAPRDPHLKTPNLSSFHDHDLTLILLSFTLPLPFLP